MPEGCFVPEVYIVWIIRFVLFWWESWYLFASVTGGLEGILESHASWVRRTSCILDIIDFSHIGSFRRTNFNALIFTLLGFLYLSGDSIRWTLYQILYSNQIYALRSSNFTGLSLFTLGYRTYGEFSLYLIIPPALTLLRNSHSLY